MVILKPYKKSELFEAYKDRLDDVYIFSMNYSEYYCIDKTDHNMLNKIFIIAKSNTKSVSEHNKNKINLKMDIDNYVNNDEEIKKLADKIIKKVVDGIFNIYKIKIDSDEIFNRP
jgi:hypothetical protein